MIKLPIPAFHGETFYDSCEITKPTPGILADVSKIAETDPFSATHRLLTGCVTSVRSEDGVDVTERGPLSALLRQLPYRSAEYVSISIMTLLDPDDGIEGVYRCPRCGRSQKSEKMVDELGEILYDTRDFVSSLDFFAMPQPYENKFRHDFAEPFELKNIDTGEIIDEVYCIEMKHPTLANCIQAQQKNGNLDGVRFEWATYVEAIESVNDQVASNQWKNRYGMLLFERMTSPEKDLVAINKKVNEYGLSRRVKKVCKNPDCGKVWFPVVNTSNFFDYAPR